MARTRKRAGKKPNGERDETQELDIVSGSVDVGEDSKRDTRPAVSATPRASRGQVRNRISHIVGLMVRGQWVRGETHRELAEEWGLDEITILHHSAEASRFLDLATNDLDQIERYCRVRLREIAEQDGPDRVQAIATTLKNVGRLNDRVDVTLATAPSKELVQRGIQQVLDDPELRTYLLEELERRGLATAGVRGLLTTGLEPGGSSNS